MLFKFNELENKNIIVKQIGSEAGTTKRQKDTLKGLGLRGIGTSLKLKGTKDVYGMLLKVFHLVEVNLE
jgi:large subunit ribosomal protein L30